MVLLSHSSALLTGVKDAFKDFLPAFRALLVALAGVVLSKWWFHGDRLWCIGIVVGIVVLGFVIEWIGEHAFLPDHPVAAVYLMEWWILVPMALGVAASAGVIIAAVELTVPDTVKDPVIKETAGAISSGLSSFLTASFISSLGDRDKSAIADRIKTRLQGKYTRDDPAPAHKKHLDAESAAELYLNSDIFKGLSGWDRETRIARAHGLAKEMPH